MTDLQLVKCLDRNYSKNDVELPVQKDLGNLDYFLWAWLECKYTNQIAAFIWCNCIMTFSNCENRPHRWSNNFVTYGLKHSFLPQVLVQILLCRRSYWSNNVQLRIGSATVCLYCTLSLTTTYIMVRLVYKFRIHHEFMIILHQQTAKTTSTTVFITPERHIWYVPRIEVL